ncbi:MAG: hypothetical protein IT384_27370 [Deltaproteobacteria bacterium]|nr:hypothetical protein [Deltaproteobacteria bacterium]
MRSSGRAAPRLRLLFAVGLIALVEAPRQASADPSGELCTGALCVAAGFLSGWSSATQGPIPTGTDGVCGPTETCFTAPDDCGSCPGAPGQSGGDPASIDSEGTLRQHPNLVPGFEAAQQGGWTMSLPIDPVATSMGTATGPSEGRDLGGQLAQSMHEQRLPDGITAGQTRAEELGRQIAMTPPSPPPIEVLPQAQGGLLELVPVTLDQDAFAGDVEDNERSDPIHPGTGEFRYHHVDLRIEGVGLPFVFERVYRSRWSYNGPLGHGWTHSYDQKLVFEARQCGGAAAWMSGDGGVVRFSSDNGRRWQAERGLPYLLRPDGSSGWRVIHPDGVESAFDRDGKLSEIRDLNGNRIRFVWSSVFAIDSTDRAYVLKTAFDTTGRRIDFDYDTRGYLTSLRVGALSARVSFAIDPLGDLVGVTDLDGYTEGYSYLSGFADTESYLPTAEVEPHCRALCLGPDHQSCTGRGVCGEQGELAEAACVAACHDPASCQQGCGECTSACLSAPTARACLSGPGGCKSTCTTSCYLNGSVRCAARADSDADPASFVRSCERDCTETADALCAREFKCERLAFFASLGFGSDGAPLGGTVSVSSDGWCVGAHQCIGANWATRVARDHWLHTYWNVPVGMVRHREFYYDCADECYACVIGGDNCPSGSAATDRVCADDCVAYRRQECLDIVKDRCPVVCNDKCEEACTGGCSESCASSCAGSCQDPRACQALCADQGQYFQRSCESGCLSECIARNSPPPANPYFGRSSELNHDLVAISNALGVWLTNVYETSPHSPSFDRVIEQQFGPSRVRYRAYDLKALQLSSVLPEDQPFVDTAPAAAELCPATCKRVGGTAANSEAWFETAANEYFVVPRGSTDPRIGTVEMPAALNGYGWYTISGTGPSGVIRPAIQLPPEGVALSTPQGIAVLRGGSSGAVEWSGAGYAPLDPAMGFSTGSWSIQLVRTTGGWIALPASEASLARLSSPICRGDFTLSPRSSTTDRYTIAPADACAGRAEVLELGSVSNETPARLVGQRDRATSVHATGGIMWVRSSRDLPASDCGWFSLDSPDPQCLEAFDPAQAAASTPSPCLAHWAVRARAQDGGLALGPSVQCGPAELSPEAATFSCGNVGAAATRAFGDAVQPIRYAAVVRSGDDRIWTYYADAAGRILRVRNQTDGTIVDRNFDDRGRLVGVRAETGERICSTYDADWNLVRRIELPRSGTWSSPSSIEERFSWGEHGRLREVYDPRSLGSVLAALNWDTRGNLLSINYPSANHLTTFVPDARGRTERIIGPDGSVSRFEFDPTSGWWTRVTRDDGGAYPTTETATRDGFGRITQLTEPGRSRVLRRWSKGGFLEREDYAPLESGPSRIVSVRQRDIAGRLAKVAGTLQTQEVALNARGLVTSVVAYPSAQPTNRRVSCFDYDARGRVVETVDPEGRRTRLVRDGRGDVYQVYRGLWTPSAGAWDDPCGTWNDGAPAGSELFLTVDRDGAGRPIRVVRGDPAAPAPWVSEIVRDGFGRGVEVRLGDGEVIRVGYDARNMAAWRAVYAPGMAALPAGLSSGSPITTESKLRALEKLSYDALGRLTKTDALWFVDQPSGARRLLGAASGWVSATQSYLDASRTIETKDFAGRTTRTVFDALGRIATVTHPDGTTTVTDVYSDLGRSRTRTVTPAPASGGRYVERVDSTDFGGVARVYRGDGAATPAEETTFDLYGRPQITRDRSHAEKRAYDPFGALAQVLRLDAAGVAQSYLRYEYNRRGDLRKTVDATGATWTVDFDLANRPLRETDPLGGITSYAYRAGTEAISRVDNADHDTESVSYDALGGVSSISAYRASATPEWRETRVSFERSVLGLLRASSDNKLATPTDDVQLTYQLDSLGAVQASTSNRMPSSIAYTRDALGRATSIVAGSQTIHRSFDLLGNLAESKLGSASVARYTYGGAGSLTGITFGNGMTTQRKYDSELRPTSDRTQYVTLQSVTTPAWFAFGWSQDGTLARIDRGYSTLTQDPLSTLYATDAFGRTTQAAYAARGTPVFSTGTNPVAPAEVSQLIAGVDPLLREAFAYNAGDRLTQKTSAGATTVPTAGKDHRFTSFGGTVTTDKAGHVTAVPEGTTFDYDGLGRTVGITVPGKGRIELLFDAFGRLTEWTGAAGVSGATVEYGDTSILRQVEGTTERVFVPGTELSPAATITGGKLYYHHSIFGDRIVMTTDASRAVVERIDYTAHGLPTITSGKGGVVSAPPSGNPLLMTGQLYFPALGLYRMQQRWYRPSWGTFLSRDPLQLIDGPNAFLYASAQPVMRVDPFGLDGQEAPLSGIFGRPRDGDGVALEDSDPVEFSLSELVANGIVVTAMELASPAAFFGGPEQLANATALRQALRPVPYTERQLEAGAETAEAVAIALPSLFSLGLEAPALLSRSVSLGSRLLRGSVGVMAEGGGRVVVSGERLLVQGAGASRGAMIPRSLGAARNPVYDRLEAAVERYGGRLVKGGAKFPNRRAARMAASEIAGDLGSHPDPIYMSEFKGAPYNLRRSDALIGRQAVDNGAWWRDDFLGHPQFGAGPHVNVYAEGIEFHLWY